MDLTVKGGLGGKETVQEILKIDPKAVVLVSTGYDDDDAVLSPQKHGFADTLKKPYILKELKEKLFKTIQMGKK